MPVSFYANLPAQPAFSTYTGLQFAAQAPSRIAEASSALSGADQFSVRPKPKIAQKVESVRPSMIRAVSRVVAQHQDVINLGQGTPSDDPPAVVIQAAKDALGRGHHQYTNVWGDVDFRKQIAQTYGRKMGIPVDADKNVTVTCGVTEASFAALFALLEKGDEVVLIEPRYDNYLPAITWNGAKATFVAMTPPKDDKGTWSLDPKKLEAAITPKTKAILLNNPHNPSGKVFTPKELGSIAAVCKKHDVIAITDEIYEHLLFDGRKHTHLASLPGMADRTITISGLSKAYDATGWRVAYTIAPAPLTDAIRKAHDFLTLCAPAAFQQAGITALKMPESYYDGYRARYAERREALMKGLNAAGLKPLPVEGAYYVLADVTHCVDKLGLKDDIAFTDFLIKKLGVAGIPGSNFIKPDPDKPRYFVRFSFCKPVDMLNDASERLKKLDVLLKSGYRVTPEDLKGPGIRDML